MFSKKSILSDDRHGQRCYIDSEINKTRLFELFSDNHDFLKSYLEYVSDHTVILGDRIKHYVNRTIRESIISYLDYERKKQNSNIIKLSMTKKGVG